MTRTIGRQKVPEPWCG